MVNPSKAQFVADFADLRLSALRLEFVVRTAQFSSHVVDCNNHLLVQSIHEEGCFELIPFRCWISAVVLSQPWYCHSSHNPTRDVEGRVSRVVDGPVKNSVVGRRTYPRLDREQEARAHCADIEYGVRPKGVLQHDGIRNSSHPPCKACCFLAQRFSDYLQSMALR